MLTIQISKKLAVGIDNRRRLATPRARSLKETKALMEERL